MSRAKAMGLPSGVLKALSFKQPFAWLIANGYLLVDDRTWATQYRGPLLIHASKGLYESYYQYLKLHSDVPIPDQDKLDYGGVVGIARLVWCGKPEALPANIRHEQRMQFAGVHPGYYGFLFADAAPLTLIPCPGKLGIFEIDVDQQLAAPPAAQATLF
ncbi:ASCH domain-containing protein [Methylophilus medardicus]|nr:hypothetical protein [Methylophilus medardicus]